jgi:DNA-binding NtrC family response regulator
MSSVVSIATRHVAGNVRELRNTLERAAIVCDDFQIRPERLGMASKGRRIKEQ